MKRERLSRGTLESIGVSRAALFAPLFLCSLAQLAPVPQTAEDFYVLTFSDLPGERLSLANFVEMIHEGTGAKFSVEIDTQKALESTTIAFPGQVRVPKHQFLGFARFQLFLRGFGCFGDEAAELTIRPVPAALVRIAFPPPDVFFGSDERGHAQPFVTPAEVKRTGVVVNQRKDTPGFVLVTGPGGSEATLMDLAGQTLRSWKDPEPKVGHWDHVTVLRDGDLLCVDSRKEVLLRLGPDGTLRWRLALAVHHEALELPDGRFFVLTRRARLVPLDAERRTVDNLVTLVASDGRVLAEHSLLDMLQAEPRAVELERPRDLADLPPGYDFDLLHASSLFRIDAGHVAGEDSPFQPGRVLVTLRNLDLVALFDLALGRCVWSFGKGRLKSPHAALALDNGNLLVLDGLDTNGGARVLELDPAAERVVWKYVSSSHGAAGFAGRGTLDPQPDGNVLVGLANEAFEVTRAGTLVWRHVNPTPGKPGRFGSAWTRLLPSEAAQVVLEVDPPR